MLLFISALEYRATKTADITASSGSFRADNAKGGQGEQKSLRYWKEVVRGN